MNSDAYTLARERISELIHSAHDAVEQIQPDRQDPDAASMFKATWTVSRAGGFLEAFAILNPPRAADLVGDFEAIAQLVARLPGASATPEAEVQPVGVAPARAGRRRTTGSAGFVRRVTVRRVLPDRRTRARRQLGDRRAASA